MVIHIIFTFKGVEAQNLLINPRTEMERTFYQSEIPEVQVIMDGLNMNVAGDFPET